MLDVPRGRDRIRSPGHPGPGRGGLDRLGETARDLLLIPGSRFSPLLMAGHAPQSDRPATIARLVEETAARAAGRTATLARCCRASPSPRRLLDSSPIPRRRSRKLDKAQARDEAVREELATNAARTCAADRRRVA